MHRLVSVKKPSAASIGSDGSFCRGVITSCAIFNTSNCLPVRVVDLIAIVYSLLHCHLTASDSMVSFSSKGQRELVTITTRLRILKWAQIAGERFGFLDTHIWLQHHMGQIIGDAAFALPLEAPVEGQADLVNHPSLYP